MSCKPDVNTMCPVDEVFLAQADWSEKIVYRFQQTWASQSHRSPYTNFVSKHLLSPQVPTTDTCHSVKTKFGSLVSLHHRLHVFQHNLENITR